MFLIVHTICEWLFFLPFSRLNIPEKLPHFISFKVFTFSEMLFFLLFVFSPGAFTTMVFRLFLPIYVSSSASLPSTDWFVKKHCFMKLLYLVWFFKPMIFEKQVKCHKWTLIKIYLYSIVAYVYMDWSLFKLVFHSAY